MRWLITILLLTSFSGHAQTAFTVLNGTASTNAASYQWKQISGTQAVLQKTDSVICRVDSLKTGIRFFELTCTNQFGESRDTVIISVVAGYNTIITSAVYKPTSLTWTITGGKGVWYYLIEKTRNGKTSQVTKYYPKGGSKYVYRQAKTIYVYTYQVTPIYINGLRGVTEIFK